MYLNIDSMTYNVQRFSETEIPENLLFIDGITYSNVEQIGLLLHNS